MKQLGRLLFLFLGVAVVGTQPRHTHLVIVVDGLRPDYVTKDVMPRLTQLGQRGIVFTAHHSVLPTVTRVNASSFVTGSYPETHGIMGNTIYVPSASRIRTFDTGERADLQVVEGADGQLLTAPTLGEILKANGRTLLAISSGSTGGVYLLNHTASGAGLIHTDYSNPPALEAKVLSVLGPPPEHATPNDAQNQRAFDAYLKLGVDDLRPDVTFIWINDPDGTAHANGIGAPLTKKSLSLVDAGIGRVEDGLRQRGLLDSTNIIVTSDHGFSTETGGFNLQEFVAPFARKLDDGSNDIVVAEGAIYLKTPDDARKEAIVAALQKRPEVGAIFTRTGTGGTLPFSLARWDHKRSGDILVSANWTAKKNDFGYKGTTTQKGVAGHGSSSPYDIHNTLIATGPDFRERATSKLATANVDIAPTLLRLLGVTPPPTMTGRVIEEGLRGGSAPSTTSREEVAISPDRSYTVKAHVTVVGSAQYLDYTEVTRR